MTTLLPIEKGELHLWLSFPDEIREPELLDRYRMLMDPSETRKHDRYRFEKDRHTCLITRALARTVLSRYTGRPAESLGFTRNSYGRPELVQDDFGYGAGEASGLRFNLSHTHGLVACAVARGADVGVDVERIDRKTLNLDIADRFFSGKEAAELRSRPLETRARRFMEYWTLKESYIKARGMGLSIPLDSFSFNLMEKGRVSVSFEDAGLDSPEHWKFFLLDPGKGFRVAVSVRGKTHASTAPITRAVVPLVMDEPFHPRVIAS